LIADTLEIKEILQLIQKDLRTLERAVYSESFSQSSNSNSNNSVKETEDVLTRHLLKLSEIEKQFQQLTNKYEEINFKIDKLNSRLSKVQADNQLRFQQLETKNVGVDSSSLTKSLIDTPVDTKKILPGSTQPQDLGTVFL
jgi:TolA-binding protein